MTSGSRRTCLGCRTKKDPAELVRLVLELEVGAVGPPRLKWDRQRRAPGRGVWLCPDEACLERALKRPRLFSRALRRDQGPLDLTALTRPPWRREAPPADPEPFSGKARGRKDG